MAAATALADWVVASPLVDGVLFGSSDGEVEGPPICAVAVAGRQRGYGKGHTHAQALASAVGELLELVAVERRERVLRATFAELGGRAFDPVWLGLGVAAREEPLDWVEGMWLDTAEAVYLPAFAVSTSNGLGAGCSREAATEHAVLELYERDAFLLAWSAGLAKQRVDLRGVSLEGAAVLAHLEGRGGRTEIYFVAQSAPAYVAVAVCRGDGVRWPAFTLGLGAARDGWGAVEKAILELGQTGPYVARCWLRGETAGIHGLLARALYYCGAEHADEFLVWLRGENGGPAPVGEVRIAVADITPRELEASPFRVVRAVGQGLQPLFPAVEGYRCPRLERALGGRDVNPAPAPIC